MTTIGYGDRGPKDNPLEIAFVIFAELVGLTFFSILLTEIVKVYQVSTRILGRRTAPLRHSLFLIASRLAFTPRS